MTLVAQMSNSERVVGYLGVLCLSCYALVNFFKWLVRKPIAPDPWDEQVAMDLKEGGTPICHRCLVPHDSSTDFCSQCGAAVGEYTNWLPYPYLFSLGHTLRIGTSGSFKRTPLTIGGFIVLAFLEYALFAPIYLMMLFRNISRQSGPDASRAGISNSAPENK